MHTDLLCSSCRWEAVFQWLTLAGMLVTQMQVGRISISIGGLWVGALEYAILVKAPPSCTELPSLCIHRNVA